MSPAATARSVVHVMSAGAARGLVEAIKSSFEHDAGARLSATFGSVGTIRELLATDVRCDVVILTAAALEPLARDGRIDATSLGLLGNVHTGIAVKKGARAPAIGDAAALREAFLGAPALFIPDPERATAGIHCVAMLKRLGIAGEMASRLRSYPHGAAAMQALARSTDDGAIGCTQVTEIKYTPGVALVGTLPPPFELRTPYAVAVTTRARHTDHARAFAARLSGDKTAALRAEGGFDI
jgi:molybdate transport system substrate-binding protein